MILDFKSILENFVGRNSSLNQGLCKIDKDIIHGKIMPSIVETISHGRIGAKNAGSNVVIIDVFRAVQTAIAILERNPSFYYMTSDESHVHSSKPNFIRIGKPFMGSSVKYDSPNSPTRVSEIDFCGRNVIHRTAGCGGCLDELINPKTVLLCTISNIEATKVFMNKHGGRWDIIAAGHQANTPVEEDNLCASALMSNDLKYFVKEHANELRKAISAQHFSADSDEYPLTDIDFCLNTDQVQAVILARKTGNLWKLELFYE